MRNIKIKIEYDGKSYYGWQKQPNKITVQSEIERAIFEVTGQQAIVISSGRTDTGVSAYGQIANFKIDYEIGEEKLALALNAHLKKSIRILKVEEVEDSFHSRYSCKRKKYMYVIDNSKYGSAIYRDRVYHIPQRLNINAMKQAIKYFEGTHDFKSFKASGASAKESVRTIYEANIEIKDEQLLLYFVGNGFLYNMVRIMVGTLVDIGLGKTNVEDLPKIIDAKDRKKSGKTVPAQGLYLMEVKYD